MWHTKVKLYQNERIKKKVFIREHVQAIGFSARNYVEHWESCLTTPLYSKNIEAAYIRITAFVYCNWMNVLFLLSWLGEKKLTRRATTHRTVPTLHLVPPLWRPLTYCNAFLTARECIFLYSLLFHQFFRLPSQKIVPTLKTFSSASCQKAQNVLKVF